MSIDAGIPGSMSKSIPKCKNHGKFNGIRDCVHCGGDAQYNLWWQGCRNDNNKNARAQSGYNYQEITSALLLAVRSDRRKRFLSESFGAAGGREEDIDTCYAFV